MKFVNWTNKKIPKAIQKRLTYWHPRCPSYPANGQKQRKEQILNIRNLKEFIGFQDKLQETLFITESYRKEIKYAITIYEER